MQQRMVNDISPVVAAIFGLMVALELVFAAAGAGLIGGQLGIGWRVEAVQDYGLNGALIDFMWERGVWPAKELLRFVTYPFLHGNFIHMAVAGAIFLAMGKFVGDRFSTLAMIVLVLVSAVGGGLAWGLLSGDQGWMIGGYTMAYGLIGALTYIQWLEARRIGARQISAFQLIGMLMAIRLILGLLFGTDSQWVGEIAAFVIGFLASFVLSPGGFARLRVLMQRD